MTQPPSPPPPGRPLPDAADLRLLAELSRAGGSIGLPQAAWQAGMSQAEAAARLVQLAGSGFPLRLVAEGDPQLLWQVVQRGPVPAAPTPPPHPPAAQPGPPAPAAPPVTPTPAPTPAGGVDPAATWGLPGSAAWTRREAPRHAADDDGPAGRPVPPPTPQASRSAMAADTVADALPAAAVAPPVGTPQRTTGLEGEQLTVTVREVVDPATEILTTAGYVLDPDERAVLVRTAVANAGPAPHDCMTDLYLFLLDGSGTTLARAPVSVAGYPAHRVGVPVGGEAEGWTVFLLRGDVRLSGVRWCVRPDLVDRTLTWSVAADPVRSEPA